MAPTKCKPTTTKHKPETTKVGEEVLDLVIPYIHSVEDRNAVSLVSRNFYEIDGITRKHVTVHTLYYPHPASLSKRFPFIEALTLKGTPYHFKDIQITPWIEQLVVEFRYLKELRIRGLVVCDEDLETLARARGKDLRILKISKCEGFSTHGLRHVSKYCNQLRTLCLKHCILIEVNDFIWSHELALNNTVLERLRVTDFDYTYDEYLTLLAKICCNSLISLKIEAFYLSKLRDVFRYALRLEQFGGEYMCEEEESELVGFQFPPNIRSLSLKDFTVTQCSTVLPFLNHMRKLKLGFWNLASECQCLLFKRCPNLEVLDTNDVCGDKGLLVIGEFCKKLRKLNHNGLVTNLGLIALAKGCTKLEWLHIRLEDISNKALECVGTHLKNLRQFRISLDKEGGITDLPLDKGIQALLIGCKKLERLDIKLWHGGLTDLGFEYIGKYGTNLRSLTLSCIGNSSVGLVKLSEGCPRLKNLKLLGCPFSEQAIASSVFNIPSLRYVTVYRHSKEFTTLALTRPEFQL